MREEGDVVKVSNIHPGNWTDVCFTSVGHSRAHSITNTVAEYKNVDRSAVISMNRDASDLTHGDMFFWGIYFISPPADIEYFRLNHKAFYPDRDQSEANTYRCMKKDDAYFKISSISDEEDLLFIQLANSKSGE